MIATPLSAQRQRGFSLVELLVVISIMGILLAMGAVSFSAAQRRGRDAKRRADMSSIQKGFEQYFVEYGNAYTAACSTMFSTAAVFPAGAPIDPQTAVAYPNGQCSASAYCFCAQLEITGSGNASGRSGTACNFGNGGDYYCVSNLQ